MTVPWKRLLEGQNLPRDEINDRQHQRDDTAPRQTDEGVRIAEGADKIARERRIAGHIGAEEAADIDHADRAGHDQRQHRENEVDHAPVRVGRFTGLLHQRRQIALRGLGLKFAHGAVIELHGDDRENEHEGQNGIEVIGNGLDEQLNAPLMDRVKNFSEKVTKVINIFDTKEVELPFTDAEYRKIVSPMIMYAITERLSCHLEKERNHPLTTRRYYRQMEY